MGKRYKNFSDALKKLDIESLEDRRKLKVCKELSECEQARENAENALHDKGEEKSWKT